MWVFGHAALGYLLVRGIHPKGLADGGPRLLFLVLLFANLLDIVHVPPSARILSHTLPGTVLFYLLAVYLCERWGIVTPPEVGRSPGEGRGPFLRSFLVGERGILLLATFSHVLGDLIASGYSILFPLTNAQYSIVPFSSPAGLIVGVILVMMAIIFMRRDGGHTALLGYLTEEVNRFNRDWQPRRPIDGGLVIPTLYGLGVVFVIGQLSYFVIRQVDVIARYSSSHVMALVAFILLTYWTLRPVIDTERTSRREDGKTSGPGDVGDTTEGPSP